MTTSLRLLAPALPATRGDLSLGETLAELRRRGIRLRRTSTGAAMIHAHMHVGLAEAVHRHNAALALWLDMGCSAVAPGLDAWDEGVRLQARWFAERFTPPAAPYALRPGETVVDWTRYTVALLDRLALGPDAPGGAADDLGVLFERFALSTEETTALPVRRAA